MRYTGKFDLKYYIYYIENIMKNKIIHQSTYSPYLLHLIMISILLFTSSGSAYAYEVGKVIQIHGDVERSSITTGKRYFIEYRSPLLYGQKIKTGPRSHVEILLANGTSVLIKEKSSVFFFSLRMKKTSLQQKSGLLMVKLQ